MCRWLLALSLLCIGKVNAQVKHTEQLEDSAYAVIAAIPEIKELIDKDTSTTWHLLMRTIDRPRTMFKYYLIQVGQTNGQRFYTQHNLYVDPASFEVFYRDTQSDSLFTLPEMRRRDSTRH